MEFPIVTRARLAAAEERLADLQQDFTGYKRRNEGIVEKARFAGGCEAFTELLPVYDNLQRALKQSCSDEAFLQGIRMTMDTLEKAMERLGIHEIPALGCPFDPQLHEAMDHIEDPELGENIIASVVLTGFCRGDTVLRHALVVVAN